MLSTDRLMHENCLENSCRHVAIIMDGNGRWAKRNGKIRIYGHEEGARSVRRTVSFASKKGIDVLTLYAFSSENWNRPIQEVNSLMELFLWTLNSEIKNLHHHNICLRIIGDTSRFSLSLQECIRKSEALTANNTGLSLNIAANYGGRWDIVQSVQRVAKQVKKGLLMPDQINEKVLNTYICMNKLTPVDLVIRTGGEYRISNFLLWQIAYSELYFTDVLWPDFNEQDFETALYAFAKRERRFGTTNSHD